MIKNWLEHLDNYYKGKDLDLMLSKKNLEYFRKVISRRVNIYIASFESQPEVKLIKRKIRKKMWRRLKYLKTKHSWHLVDPSPWPLVASLGAFFMTLGSVLYMNKFLGGSQLALVGVFVLLYVMYTWWRDIIREATFEEQHTLPVQRGLRLGMILFIVSEIMFFFAFFSFFSF